MRKYQIVQRYESNDCGHQSENSFDEDQNSRIEKCTQTTSWPLSRTKIFGRRNSPTNEYFREGDSDMAQVTLEDVKEAISNDMDFIALPRFQCSLRRFVERYPDGSPNGTTIAKALCLSEQEIEEIYAKAMLTMKAFF